MEKMIETRQEVLDFLRVDEYPNGSSCGDGYGYSSGRGYDCGNGYGCGGGCGDGYNYSPDRGDGCGNGCGDGKGSGNVYGEGDGWGDGHSIEVFNGMVVHRIDKLPTLIDSVHGNFAKGRILYSNLTTKSWYIAKCGNYFAHGETLEDAFRNARDKYAAHISIEERIAMFNKQFPDRDKKVPAEELFSWHHVLTGSCLAGRKYFCEERGLDYENGEYTVNEFISLTMNAYNGSVIRQLKKSKP